MTTSVDRLIDGCRFHPRHAEQAEAALRASGTAWAGYRDQLLSVTSDLPHGGMVFLLGEMGRGKTQMCACMALADLDKGDPRTRRAGRYIRAHEMLMQFRDAQKIGREVATLRELAAPRLLFIDDVHELKGTDYEHRSMVAVIDERVYAGRWTILVANSTRAKLGALIDQSIAHRAQEGKVVITVEGTNFRQGASA